MEYIKLNIMKVIYLLITLILFTSCSFSIEPVKNADSITTVEMVREIEKDTITYKILKTDNKIYLVNKDTNKIEKEINITTKSYVDNIILIIMFIAVCYMGFRIIAGL